MIRHNIWMLISLVFALAACGEDVPEGKASDQLGRDLRGATAPVGVIMARNAQAHWLVQAVAKVEEPAMDQWPALVTLVTENPVCSMTGPTPGQKLVNVHVGKGKLVAPLFAFSRADLAKRTQRWISAYRRKGKGPDVSQPSKDAFRMVDVVITDTSAPLFLVLQNEWSNVLWNLTLAKDVRIAHVAVISNGRAGVAHVPPAVPVEFMGPDMLQSCQVSVARKPADDWGLVRNVKAANGSMGDILEKNERMATTYSRWFAKQFGVDPETNVAGLDLASAVLVGPLPPFSDRPKWQGLLGSNIRLMRADHVVVGGVNEYRQKHDETVVQLATDLAGGDLANLRQQ